jgi:thiol-disulfide isomerase/thioredoxin
MIDFGHSFSSAQTYAEFLEAYGSDTDRNKWQMVLEKIGLSAEQASVLASFTRNLKVLCMAGAWCGDCVRQCPILHRFSQMQPLIELRFVDRDANDQLKNELVICGAPRVPQVVFLSEDDEPVGRYGDRTISYYRDMAQKISGALCSTGLVTEGDPLLAAVTNDWLTEIERVQLILRTSPRLREKHGD